MTKPQRNALVVLAVLAVISVFVMVSILRPPKPTDAGPIPVQARHMAIPGVLATIGAKIAAAGPRIVLDETVFRVAPGGSQTVAIPPSSDASVTYRRGSFALAGDAQGHVEYVDAGADSNSGLHDQTVDFPPEADADPGPARPATGDGTSIVATASGGVVTLRCKSSVECDFSFH